MIFAWFFRFIASVISALITALPAPSVPAWLSNLSTDITTWTSGWSGLSTWIPASLMVLVIASWGASYLIALAIKVTRIGASYLTGGGGSAY